MNVSIQLEVNGKQISRQVEPRLLLVHLLREELSLTGTRLAATPANAGPVPSCSTARR
jgi:carbon-monoxide dehydrogenase small subunit